MTLAMSGATRERLGPRLRPGQHDACRSAARSGWPCWPRSRPQRTDSLLAGGESTAAALTGGYHLAFSIAAGLVVAAIVVALTVLDPTAVQPRTRRPSRAGRSGAGLLRGRLATGRVTKRAAWVQRGRATPT